jgi:hypothetical protein
MTAVRMIWGTTWRSVLVGVSYAFTLVATGVISSVLGVQMSSSPGSESLLVWVLISGILIGAFLGPLASQMHISFWRHFFVWASVIFFNMGSVAIEGAFFAPELVSIPLPVLLGQQLLASAVIAILITILFSSPGESTSLVESFRFRTWHSWACRFVVSSLSYLLFYFSFGALNYSLVTEPYYISHTGGLTVPPLRWVLAVEAVRAPLIVFSIGLFIFSFRATKRRLTLMTGFMLFWIGGVVPLLFQVNILPLPLLVASGVEILFQNFLTGVVAALLLWTPQLHAVVPSKSP